MDFLRFSIIVPIYNVEKYLGNCLESLVSQLGDDYEIIAVIDGSTDSSQSIVESYVDKHPEKIRSIYQQNKGLGGARNTGMKAAVGEYILFVDSDDYVTSDYLKCIRRIVEDYHVEMMIFDDNMVDENGKIIRSVDMRRGLSGTIELEHNKELLLAPPAAWNKVFKRELIERTGVRFPEHTLYEDTMFTKCMMMHSNGIYCHNGVLYNYLQRSSSIMGNRITEKCMDIITVCNDLINIASERELYDEYKNEIEYIVSSSVLLLIVHKIIIEHGNQETAQLLIKYIRDTYPNCSDNKYYAGYEKAKIEVLLSGDLQKYLSQFALTEQMRDKMLNILPKWSIRYLRKLKGK